MMTKIIHTWWLDQIWLLPFTYRLWQVTNTKVTKEKEKTKLINILKLYLVKKNHLKISLIVGTKLILLTIIRTNFHVYSLWNMVLWSCFWIWILFYFSKSHSRKSSSSSSSSSSDSNWYREATLSQKKKLKISHLYCFINFFFSDGNLGI